MAEVETNSIGLSGGFNNTEGTIPSNFQRLPFTEIARFNAVPTFTQSARVSSSRQQYEGVETSRVAGVEYTTELDLDTFLFHIGPMCYSVVTNQVGMNLKPDSVATGQFRFTTTPLTSTQQALFGNTHLVWCRGFTNPANNGLKAITTGATSSAIGITGLVSETNPTGTISYGGSRFPLTGLTWGVNGGIGSLTYPNISSLLSYLTKGEMVEFGSRPSYLGTVQNGLHTTAGQNVIIGRARYLGSNGNVANFDLLDTEMNQNHVPTSSGSLDIRSTGFVSNVYRTDVSARRHTEHWGTFERADPGLGPLGQTRYKYGLRCRPDNFTIAVVPEAIVTSAFSYEAKDVSKVEDTRRAGITLVDPVLLTGFSPSLHVGRIGLRNGMQDIGVTVFDSTLSVDNQVTRRNAIGYRSARNLPFGNFIANLEFTLSYSYDGLSGIIDDHTPLTYLKTLANRDGALHINLPSFTLSGTENLEAGDIVTLPGTGNSFESPVFNASAMFSIMHGPSVTPHYEL